MVPHRIGISPGYAIIMVVVLLAVIVYTVLAVRKQAAEAEKKGPPDPALKQLKDRYKRGEMSREDYEIKKKRLRNKGE